MRLEGQRVLLGVSGGIAAYKAAALARLLVKAGASVRVLMTSGAQAFVTPLTFQALTGNPVHTDLLDPAAEAAMGHIELARWADQVIIAPASANVIARLAAGLADDLLTTTCLATEAPVALAPAMNSVMWANAATQANQHCLAERGLIFIGPASGDQACGEFGPGRMVEPADVVAALESETEHDLFSGQRVLITAGPTYEDLDPVRFLGNRSSGKMGYALAAAAAKAGAQVTLVSGPVGLDAPAGVTRISLRSAQEMYDAVTEHVGTADVFIAAAAVADYRPTSRSESKIKKRSQAGQTLTVQLTENIDILHAVAQCSPRPFVVGFAAETNDVELNARAKLERKGADIIMANDVGAGRAFDRDDNAVTAIWKDGCRQFGRQSKEALANQLVSLIAERLSAEGHISDKENDARHPSQTT